MVEEIRENRLEGRYYPTERIDIVAVLMTAGHPVYEYTLSPTNRLVAWFPFKNDKGIDIQETLRLYGNRDLPLDARSLVENWMHCRDLTRNKRFIRGTTKAPTNRPRG
jgi:hypothetical protein